MCKERERERERESGREIKSEKERERKRWGANLTSIGNFLLAGDLPFI